MGLNAPELVNINIGHTAPYDFEHGIKTCYHQGMKVIEFKMGGKPVQFKAIDEAMVVSRIVV